MADGDWTWSVAFKQRGRAGLKWVETATQDVMEASRQARGLISKRYAESGYVEYGHSKTRHAGNGDLNG